MFRIFCEAEELLVVHEGLSSMQLECFLFLYVVSNSFRQTGPMMSDNINQWFPRYTA
jgi:hypothetical protein